MSDEPNIRTADMSDALHPEVGAFLNVAIRACMQYLGGDAALIGAHDDDEITPGTLARIGKQFVIVEQPADAAANLSHTFGLFRIGGKDGEFYRLAPERCLFMLLDQRPRGWHLQICQASHLWFSEVMLELHHALEPYAPPPN